MAMQFPAQAPRVACGVIPELFYIGMPVVRTDGVGPAYGHVITQISRMDALYLEKV